MADCDHNCENCKVSDCSSRITKFSLHRGSSIKNKIGIVSAKGGVGKSLVTSLLAIKKNREGNKVAILDADITGPSIAKSFNIKGALYANEDNAVIPLVSKTGIKVISASSLLENNTEPILYRGPLIAGMVKQFYTDVDYGELDYLFIDMPPGTADVSLTVFQSLDLEGIIIVTTPQELVTEIVTKAINMANAMNINILGIVENMSYIKCPKCDEKIEIFGKSHIDEITNKFNIKLLGKLPIDPEMTKLVDNGNIEDIKNIDIDF